MTKIVIAKTVPAYSWDCPGCGESNLDDMVERVKIHMECKMDYVSVKCSNCNGSYIIDSSLGWLTKRLKQSGASVEGLKKIKKCSLCDNTGKPCKCGEYHGTDSICPPHEVRMKWADNICPECGRIEEVAL